MTSAARALALLLILPIPALGQELFSRRTQSLNLIYYDRAHEPLTYHLTRAFENSLNFHKKLFSYEPSEPVVLLMQDFGDYGHAGASTVPWNYISLGIEPFDYVYDTMPANERMNWLMHHELVHIAATDQAADRDIFYRRLFRGKVAPTSENPLSMLYSFLTSPRWYSPRWYHEGIAVFLETWMAGGVGRVLGGYDEMAFRTMTLEDAYFYDVVGLESEGTTIDFQIGQNSYLYGTRFVTYLALQHGPEKVIEWFSRRPGTKRYFVAQFRHVFGTPLDDEWRRWIDWERQWQKENLARIRQYPVTEQRPITRETLGSVSRSFYDPETRRLYVAVNRPARPAQIVAVDVHNGAVQPLAEVSVPMLFMVTSLAYDAKAKKLFFTSDNSRGWRDLHELDLVSRRTRLLLKNARTGDLVVNPADQSIWGIQHHNGLSSIVRIPPPYDGWKTLVTIEYGRDIYDIDISPDGKTLSAALIDVTGRQQLVTLSIEHLLEGKSTFDVLHEFANNSPSNFVFSPDGRYLYGTSYYTGPSNVFRYDLQNRKVEAITNVETGLFRPVPVSDSELIAYRYTSKGFDPVFVPIRVLEDVNAIHYLGQEVVERHPIVKSWNAGSPARVDLDAVTTYEGEYRPLAQFGLASIYPVLEGYKDTVAGGVRINFADPLALHTMDVTAAVSASEGDEKLHLNVAYHHNPWSVDLKYNATDFYDLFGPTKTSRKGHSASVTYQQFLIYERPRLFDYRLTAAYYGGLETLPEYQNVRTPFREYSTVSGRVDYQDLRRTIGALEPERGFRWTAQASARHVAGDIFPRIQTTYERGFLLPLEHSSLWLRGAAGRGFGDRENPFSNFYFGGFGNNWIDYQDAQRYRHDYSFPGVDLNEIGGNDFAKAGVEWTLPPVRFERLGVPSFYAKWARLALFSSALSTDLTEGRQRRTFYDVGAQLDLSLVVFTNLDSTLSAGYAIAFGEGLRSNEVMISLKLLR